VLQVLLLLCFAVAGGCAGADVESALSLQFGCCFRNCSLQLLLPPPPPSVLCRCNHRE
jgi:hypothetical protein